MTRMRSWGAALLVPIFVACGSSEADEAPTIQTTAVVRGDLMITAEATGSLEPILKVEVKSKASGEILRLHVDIGDEVDPGALLAEIDPRDVRNDFNQTEADLQVARARLEISQAQLNRSEELLRSGVISTQEHESRSLDLQLVAALGSLQCLFPNSNLCGDDSGSRVWSARALKTRSS